MRRIALSTLLHDRVRLAAALVAVAVATQLVLILVGIYHGFAATASAPVRRTGGDVWVMSRDHRQLDHSPMLPASVRVRLAADPCVDRARGAVFLFTTMRRGDGAQDAIQLVGVEPGSPGRWVGVPWSVARGLPADLRARGSVTLDTRDATLAGLRDPLGASLEIAAGRGRVTALSRGLRGNFGIHPIVFASVETVRDLADLPAGAAQYWVLDLSRPSCAASTIAAIQHDPDLVALPTEEFAVAIERDLLETSGIGVALAFIAALGFAVAAAIVSQTLLAGVRQHRRELAMLKSLGARPSELLSFVAWQTALVAVIGVAIGVALAVALRGVLSGLSVPVVLPLHVALMGAASVVALCAVASLFGVRAVLRIEASEVLR